ncbi:hypothetical protein BJ875DRAFT_447168 [Amylocarpus encephaloides]|uniref:Uncharacterized protein n=1 Tax=Amylocarpus encephaloides TaxID=45428 RepID=A0A9P8C0G0_9HELO|nr:hypothetical protein BJ875DRAFT_447168 [Amylocarpus encephaloides]
MTNRIYLLVPFVPPFLASLSRLLSRLPWKDIALEQKQIIPMWIPSPNVVAPAPATTAEILARNAILQAIHQSTVKCQVRPAGAESSRAPKAKSTNAALTEPG